MHNPFPVGEGYFRNIAIKSFVCITVLKMPPWYSIACMERFRLNLVV